jgi:PPM family protein phosphatase
MTGHPTTCPRCAANVAGADRFCESCGAIVAEVRRVAIPREPLPLEGQEGPCSDCGDGTYSDGYCSSCGSRRAEPDRDEAQLGRIALITDRGLVHASNEDAAAAGIVIGPDPGRPYAIAVAVCDGVSTSAAAQLAAVAASKAGVDAMLAALAASRTGRAAALAGLADAANAAAAAGAGADPSTAPSCTYTAAAVVPTSEGAVQITIGNVGDSRAYWLPEPPLTAQQLTVDDSVAQELITAGAAAESEAVQRGAHTLTRWLGADSEPQPWSDASVQTITATGPGLLLMCTDGLWNYLPDPADIARFCTGTDPIAAARALVDHALREGGHDNVTVALIPIGGPHDFD